MPTNNIIKLKYKKYTCLRIQNSDVWIIDWIANLSIEIKWTQQQNKKSNKHKTMNFATHWWNHEEKTRTMRETLILIEIERKKIKMSNFRLKVDPKSSLDEENAREPGGKNKVGLLESEEQHCVSPQFFL